MSSWLDTRTLDEELTALEDAFSEDAETGALDEYGSRAEALERLEVLRDLRDEIPEWQYGETLIPEDDFEDYARQLAEDMGAISDNAQWPLTCIDWEQAAEQLRMDYSECELDGITYLYRS